LLGALRHRPLILQSLSPGRGELPQAAASDLPTDRSSRSVFGQTALISKDSREAEEGMDHHTDPARVVRHPAGDVTSARNT
jgi:hypothetical protein